MGITAIREKLHHYIETAQDKKVRALFTIIEDEIEEGKTTWTDEFLEELNKRVDDFETGKIKGRTWQEVKKASRKR